jgi:short-subunit dehydrogenase
MLLQKRNATVAVIGAGDYIGGEIAKKFASEGFTVFAGRRNGAKLDPLVKSIEAAGGEIHARSLDARGCSGRSGRWRAIRASGRGGRRRG